MLGGSLDLLPAWSQHEAAAQEIEARPTKHLAFQHFQPVNVPLDGTRTPGQGASRFHRFVILVQPGGEALHGGHDTIAAGIATLAEVAKQAHRGVAPRIPALAEIRLIRGEDTVAEVAATFAPCKGGASEITLHRAQPQPDLLRNGRSRPALVVQGPDLLMQGLPAGLALPRALLGGSGRL